jgi:hypothetical protein
MPSGAGASARRWALPVAASLAAIGLASFFRSPALLEAWLFGFIVLAGLATGALGLLMIGHLLGGYWLDPVRDELEAAALTMPLVAILALPLAFGLGQLFPWAVADAPIDIPALRRTYFEPSLFLIRSAAYLALWTALAIWIAQPGEHRGRSAVGLALLAPTAALAGIDWVMSRDPEWWSSLFGFAFAVSQLLPALAGAVLITILRPDRPDEKRLRSLERALMTLALMTLWLWFVQFLVVWMANLPAEVAWYLARYDRWGWVMLVVVVPSMIVGILLLLPPSVGGFLLRAACALLIVQHVAHMLWLANPAVDHEGAHWTVVAVPIALAAIWALWLVAALARGPNLGVRVGEDRLSGVRPGSPQAPSRARSG